ncbi:hypothetical protein PsorP6_005522 [Peronosclerospora sorghi]|uniref:Uncharacterized protein n=1 Tax=Peronosclerospora sorghi TaxID=230839 RepID=A0ACC0W514_9STRA|nr:hypothetical protein PsorP6_005522 [Peronosclerospora sorghi]
MTPPIATSKAKATSKRPVPATALPVASQFNRLDARDLDTAMDLGLLLETLVVSPDAAAPEFGVAYEKQGGTRAAGCGSMVFPSQRALQERCKQFAMARGFQLFVAGSSTRPKGGGNVKYRCKRLHGQQFFDPSLPATKQHCPFYINGCGKEQRWKITRACFLHNHYKFIGWRAAATSKWTDPVAGPVVAAVAQCRHALLPASTSDGEESRRENEPQAPVPFPAPSSTTRAAPSHDHDDDDTGASGQPQRIKSQRNTTMSMKALCRMVKDEVNKYPASNVVLAKLDGKMIRRMLLGQGHTINHMMSSRIRRQLQEERITKVRTSFQQLRGYFNAVAQKNPTSFYRVETRDDGAFTRALFISNATRSAVAYCRKLLSLDHITYTKALPDSTTFGPLDGDENDDRICGVYLKACIKDFNDDVITIALALVTEENERNWEWFLHALQSTHEVTDWNEYTVIAGRSGGLEDAIRTVWSRASHHLCMRRVIEEDLVVTHKIPLTRATMQHIFDLARSDSQTEYDTLRQALGRTHEAVVAFLDTLERKRWVKYAFLEAYGRPTFNELTSDLSMASGSDKLLSQQEILSHTTWFGEEVVSSSHPLYTFQQYFQKLAAIFDERRQAAKMRPMRELVPRRDAQLQQILPGSQRCESIPCANGLYMVRYLGPTRLKIPDSWRHVNLTKWECTCQAWQDQAFPCLHAIHAAELDQRRIDSLYDVQHHSMAQLGKCYGSVFTPPTSAEASDTERDVSMKTPLDFFFSQDGSGRRKPGPRPKVRRRNKSSSE